MRFAAGVHFLWSRSEVANTLSNARLNFSCRALDDFRVVLDNEAEGGEILGELAADMTFRTANVNDSTTAQQLPGIAVDEEIRGISWNAGAERFHSTNKFFGLCRPCSEVFKE
jgi:hypothetical protein